MLRGAWIYTGISVLLSQKRQVRMKKIEIFIEISVQLEPNAYLY